MGWPGQIGQTSFAALSQTVNTKSSCGAPGYGGIMLSGSRCAAANIREAFHVEPGETILGFVSIGTIVDTPKLASRPQLSDVLRVYDGT